MRSLFVALLFALVSCARPLSLQAPAGAEITPLRTISIAEARRALAGAGVDAPVANAIDCYRIEYSFPGPGGQAARLSGLLALPRGVAPRLLVSFQPGPDTRRSAAPSELNSTGLAAAAVFAGNGYALLVPDYPGLGMAEGRHPYYVAETIGPAVVALIDTAQRLEQVRDAPLFLVGFSEGGWASLTALRILEEEGRPVLGSAQVAAPYDLRRVSLPALLQRPSPSTSFYLGYVVWGQAGYYDHPLDSVLNAEYAPLVERLYAEGSRAEIMQALPRDPRVLFNASFLDAFDHDRPHWFLDSLAANSLTEFTPRTPVRLYYGGEDSDVVPEEALNTERAMRARGGDALAINVGAVGHDPAMLAATPLILTWLHELEAAGGAR